MDIGALFKRVWPVFTQNIVTFLLAVVISFAVQFGVSLVLGMIPIAGQIASIIIGPALNGLFLGGIALMAGKSLSGATISLSDLFVPFQDRQVDYAVVGLAMFAGVLACGIGVLATAFLFMVAPIMAADGMGYQDAIRRSYEMVTADVGGFLLLFLAGIVLQIITCGLFGPLVMLAIAQVYIDQKNAAGAGPAPTPQPPQPF